MTRRLGPVLSARDLPLAELSSARLDGEVFPLDEFWCPIDEIDAEPARARAAGMLVPARAIAERMSAAWIYGLAPEPRRHQFCVDLEARAHVPLSTRLHLREVSCPPEDTQLIAGFRVTTPVRTVVDLARWSPDEQPGLPELLAALLRYGRLTPAEAAARLIANTPHAGAALLRLDAAASLLDAGDPAVVAPDRAVPTERAGHSDRGVHRPAHVVHPALTVGPERPSERAHSQVPPR